MQKRFTVLVLCLLVGLLVNSVASAKTVVTVWAWSDVLGEFIARKAEEFNQMQDEIEIIVEQHPFDGYFDKLQMAQVSGVAPEILRGGFEGLISPYPDDFYAPSLVEHMKSQQLPFFEDFIAEDGKVYAYPFSLWTTPLWYNRVLFAEAGLGDQDVPKTWDELIQVAKKLTKVGADNQVVQYGFVTEPTDFLQVWLPQAAPDYYHTGDRQATLVGTGAVDAYRFFLDLIENQLIPWPVTEWCGTKFLNQTAAMIMVGSWFYGTAQQATFDWAIAPQPRPTLDAPYGATCIASDWRFGYGIDEGLKQAGAEFLRYVYSEPNSVECALSTGLLPVRLEYYQAPELAENHFFQVCAQILPHSTYKLDGTVWDTVWNALSGATNTALWELMHPTQAVTLMEKQVNTALTDYYR